MMTPNFLPMAIGPPRGTAHVIVDAEAAIGQRGEEQAYQGAVARGCSSGTMLNVGPDFL